MNSNLIFKLKSGATVNGGFVTEDPKETGKILAEILKKLEKDKFYAITDGTNMVYVNTSEIETVAISNH